MNAGSNPNSKKYLSQSTQKRPLLVGYKKESPQIKGKKGVTVLEYRKMLSDYVSTDEQITKRLQYVEALCRNVVKSELQTYLSKNKKRK